MSASQLVFDELRRRNTPDWLTGAAVGFTAGAVGALVAWTPAILVAGLPIPGARHAALALGAATDLATTIEIINNSKEYVELRV